jgi:hypothetical protein
MAVADTPTERFHGRRCGHHYEVVTRTTARHAAVQVGEFAIGAVAAYVAVGAVWLATGAPWAPILVAIALAASAALVEVRYGAKATGFVVGVLPTAVVLAVLLAAVSLVLARYR